MEYISKSAVLTEIERKLSIYTKRYDELTKHEVWITAKEIEHRIQGLKEALSIINTLETKEVDLEKELIKWHKEHFKKDGTFIGMSGFYLTNNSQMDIAKYFYELGLKTKVE